MSEAGLQARGERIVLLDAVRGLAVLGILICNAPVIAYSELLAASPSYWPGGESPANLAEWTLVQVFFQQRFYTLFALMFGVSMLLVGGEGLFDAQARTLLRRLLVLIPLGAIHGFLIWNGDVLVPLAVGGLAVFVFRGWRPSWLIALGIAIYLGLFTYEHLTVLAKVAHFDTHAPSKPPPTLKEVFGYPGIRTYAQGFRESLQQNIADYQGWLGHCWRYVVEVAALMLAGMGLFKLGLFTGDLPRGVYLGLVGAGAFGLFVTAFMIAAQLLARPAPLVRLLSTDLQELCAPAVSLGYLSLLALALRSTRFAWLPRLLAPVGRMAFTNYIAQSLLMTALLYGGRGPGLFGKVEAWQLGLICVAVWALQIVWSHAWLSRFESGPLEWVWRLLYRGPGALRRRAPPAAVPA